MMIFEPGLNWNLIAVIVLLIIALWIFQSMVIFKAGLSKGRKSTRFGLITFLTIVLIGLLLQPTWTIENSEDSVLIFPAGTNELKLSDLKDSLNVTEAIAIEEYRGDALHIFLYGQDYTLEELSVLSGSKIQWIKEDISEGLTYIQWEDLLHLGEAQTVSGSLSGEGPFVVQLITQGEVVSKDSLVQGEQDFYLRFRTEILGRNQMTLVVNENEMGKVNFFVMPAAPVQYSLLFGYPNPEGRFLSEYLVKRGDDAKVSSQISRGVRVDLGSEVGQDEPKVWISDPSQLDNRELMEEIKEGEAAVLVINLSEPLKELPRINQQLGTDFSVNQLGVEPRVIGIGVTAAPFEFRPASNQGLFLDNVFAIQMVGNNRIGVSLLEPTFSLVIGGDSLTYQQVWETVLAPFSPVEPVTYELNQTVFAKAESLLSVSTFDQPPSFIKINEDSLKLQSNIVNDRMANLDWIPQDTGWLALSDTLEIYSYSPEEWPDIHQISVVSHFLKSERAKNADVQNDVPQTSQIQSWIWLVLILLAFGLVWLEPRL